MENRRRFSATDAHITASLTEQEAELDVLGEAPQDLMHYSHNLRTDSHFKQWQWLLAILGLSLFLFVILLFAYLVVATSSGSPRQILLLTVESASDLAITVSYFIIPGSLAYIGHRRKDLSNNNPFILLFAGFILSCGLTHLLVIPSPWIEFPHLLSFTKFVCSILSVATAISCYSLIGVALSVPTIEDVQVLERERQSAHVQLRQLAVHKLSSLLKQAENPPDLAQIINHEFRSLLKASAGVVYSHTASQGVQQVCHEYGEDLPLALPIHTIKGIESALILRREHNELRATSLDSYLQTPDYQSVAHPTSSHYVSPECAEQLLALPYSYFLIFVVEQSAAMQETSSFMYVFESEPSTLDFLSTIQLEQLITQVQLAYGKLMQLQIASTQADILRQRNEVLKLAKESAEKASQSKSDFLATVSHDIRTPMNAICGMTTVLEDLEDLPDDARECITIISESNQTLLSLIDDILDFSAIENGKKILNKVVYNLPEEIHRKINMLRQTIPPQSKFNLHLSPIPKDIPEAVIGERTFLGRIISNLLRNAIKYTSRGKITLAIECLSKTYYDHARVLHESGDARSIGRAELQITVSDTGKGVRSEDINRLFHPFERLSETTTEGTGLGLTICKRLVEMMGGRIWVDSTLGVGSTFGFTLPVEISATAPPQNNALDAFDRYKIEPRPVLNSPPPMGTPPRGPSTTLQPGMVPGSFPNMVVTGESNKPSPVLPHVAPSTPPRAAPASPQRPSRTLQPGMSPGGGLAAFPTRESANSSPVNIKDTARILIVEDNRVNQTVLIKLLRKLGFNNITIAERGDLGVEAVKKAIEEEQPFHTVFMDVHMPVMGGIEACQIIKQRGYHIPHLVGCTANAQQRTFEQFAEVGATDFIPKPINFRKLTKVMEEIEESLS